MVMKASCVNISDPSFPRGAFNEIKRDNVKKLISTMIDKKLARSTVRNAISVLRGIFNQAIEDGIIEANPAVRLRRFTRTAKTTEVRGIALTTDEVQKFLNAAKEICPEYYTLFLLAVRAGLRRGELVALRFGDIAFGGYEKDPQPLHSGPARLLCAPGAHEHQEPKEQTRRYVA